MALNVSLTFAVSYASAINMKDMTSKLILTRPNLESDRQRLVCFNEQNKMVSVTNAHI